MKKPIMLLACVLAIGSTIAQNNTYDEAKNVLRLSREKCLSIQQGHYVMERKMKFMSDKDTTAERHTCDFRKLPDDTIYGKSFHMLFEPMDEKANWRGHIIYTGREQVWISDTTAVIQSCDQWADKIIAGRHNRVFYTALTNKSCYPIPDEEHLADSSYSYSISDAELDGRPCHLARYRKTDFEPDTVFGINTLLYEVSIWIDKRDYMPIQYTVAFDNIDGPDTVYQYEECKLVAFDPKVHESKLTLESIPDNMVQRDYVPYKAPEPLAEGTSAPDWSLPTLAGDTVRLADLRGKVVLLDFFYKHCAPCCAALPGLQRLHEKYKDQGVVILGIDPIDDPIKDEMADFIAKRGITYTVLFSDNKLSETYRVHAFPTLFILDRDGKIVTIHTGFLKTMEDDLEELLLKMP